MKINQTWRKLLDSGFRNEYFISQHNEVELAQLNTATKTKDKGQVFSLSTIPKSQPACHAASVWSGPPDPPSHLLLELWEMNGSFSQADPSIPVSSGRQGTAFSFGFVFRGVPRLPDSPQPL